MNDPVDTTRYERAMMAAVARVEGARVSVERNLARSQFDVRFTAGPFRGDERMISACQGPKQYDHHVLLHLGEMAVSHCFAVQESRRAIEALIDP